MPLVGNTVKFVTTFLDCEGKEVKPSNPRLKIIDNKGTLVKEIPLELYQDKFECTYIPPKKGSYYIEVEGMLGSKPIVDRWAVDFEWVKKRITV